MRDHAEVDIVGHSMGGLVAGYFFCPPSQAARLHRGIRCSELVFFERSGHYPFVEEPEAFQRAVRTWIAGDP